MSGVTQPERTPESNPNGGYPAIVPAVVAQVQHNATMELTKLGDLDVLKQNYDKMENFLWSAPGGSQLAPKDVEKHTASLIERATVERSNINAYIRSVCTDAVTRLQTETAKATFESNLQRSIITSEMSTLFHEICIPTECAGKRVLEIYLLASKALQDGRYSFIIAHYADIARLSEAFKWAAANHDEKKVKMWLNYKLYLKLAESCPEILEEEPNSRVEQVTTLPIRSSTDPTAITDISAWEIRGIHSTIESILENELTRGEELGFHFSDEAGAHGIGKDGLRKSRVGWHGGGYFWSKCSPVEDYSKGNPSKFSEIFEEFRVRQLQRNYGEDTKNRDRHVDYVVLCKIPKKIIAAVGPDRDGAIFVQKTVYPESFPKEKLLHVWKLRP